MKIPINRTLSYLEKIKETKLFLAGLIIGLAASIFSQILLLPLKYESVTGNDNLIKISYGNNTLWNGSLGGFVIIYLIIVLIVLFLTWKFILRKIHKIPERDECYFPHNKKPELFAKEIKNKLKGIIDFLGMKYYSVVSRAKEGEFMIYLFEGEENQRHEDSEFTDSDFQIEIRKGVIMFRWKPKEEILDILNQWNSYD